MRLVVVSNRVAVPDLKGPQAGGMTVGIGGALQEHGGLWFGWSGRVTDREPKATCQYDRSGVKYVTLDLPKQDFAGYYSGFSNQVLWPLFHRRSDIVHYKPSDYASYLRINKLFADKLVGLLRPDDVLWVHDYHLIPLAYELRRRGVINKIGFFLHTPFANPDETMKLPVAEELRTFMSGYDLVGVQTRADLRSFRRFILKRDLLRNASPPRPALLPRSDVFPISIDTEEFESMAAEAEIEDQALAAIFAKLNDGVLPLISVDRLDYSKGIPERLRAFETLLRLYPALAHRVHMIQVAPVGRGDIPAYQEEAVRVKRACASVLAGAAGESSPPCIDLHMQTVDRPSLAAAFRRSRVGLVTPMRDGMNLVAKEFIAAQNPQDPGVLVLSRFAGAAEELVCGAILVDPGDFVEVADAIQEALGLTQSQRVRRWKAMIDILRRNDAAQWSSRFVTALADPSNNEAASMDLARRKVALQGSWAGRSMPQLRVWRNPQAS